MTTFAQQRAKRQIEVLRSLGTPVRRRRRNIPRPAPVLAQEIALRDLARAPLQAFQAEIVDLLDSLPQVLAYEAERRRVDAAWSYADFLVKLQQILARTAGTYGTDRLRARGAQIGADVAAKSRATLANQVASALGVTLVSNDKGMQALIDQFALDNARKIQGITQTYATQIADRVGEAVRTGTRHEDLRAELVERFGVAASRATTIARTQIAALYGQTNAQQQKNAGITRFTWRTSHDERVRPEHQALDNEIFEYSAPPAVGIPGEDYNCRCYAEPVLDDLLAP